MQENNNHFLVISVEIHTKTNTQLVPPIPAACALYTIDCSGEIMTTSTNSPYVKINVNVMRQFIAFLPEHTSTMCYY